jgi:formate-dependent nitrite reductase membrane component NrfD
MAMNGDIDFEAWRHPIVWCVFLGGIAAGSFALSALATLLGSDEDGRATRLADYIAFPLVVIGGVLSSLDSPLRGRPQATLPVSTRFLAMGAFSLQSLIVVLVEDGWVPIPGWPTGAGRLRRSGPGKFFAAAGGCVALWFGAQTGVMRLPAWLSANWLGAVFLASAASTGGSAVVLLDCWRKPDATNRATERVARAIDCAIVLELALLTALALSLRGLAGLALQRWPGMLLPLFVVPIGLVLPLVLRHWRGARGAVDSALLVLLGGFVLPATVAGIPGSLPFK